MYIVYAYSINTFIHVEIIMEKHNAHYTLHMNVHCTMYRVQCTLVRTCFEYGYHNILTNVIFRYTFCLTPSHFDTLSVSHPLISIHFLFLTLSFRYTFCLSPSHFSKYVILSSHSCVCSQFIRHKIAIHNTHHST